MSGVEIVWGKGHYEDFYKEYSDRPWVLVSCAISLDGKLVSETGDSRLSSWEDKVEVHKLRSIMDGILVGVNTILQDDPHLTVSEKYYKSDKHPIRIVLDSKARTPITAEVLKRKPEVPTIIAVGNQADKEKIKKLEGAGATVIELPRSEEVDGLDLRVLLRILKEEYGVKKLMVEGGGHVIGSFVKFGLVDYFRVSINPVLLGGKRSVNMLESVTYGNIDKAPRLEIVKIEKAGWSIIHHYIVKKRENL